MDPNGTSPAAIPGEKTLIIIFSKIHVFCFPTIIDNTDLKRRAGRRWSGCRGSSGGRGSPR